MCSQHVEIRKQRLRLINAQQKDLNQQLRVSKPHSQTQKFGLPGPFGLNLQHKLLKVSGARFASPKARVHGAAAAGARRKTE